MILWLAVSPAWATTTPELELCRAAATGDVRGTDAWIRKGADLNAFGRVGLDPSRPADPLWSLLGGVLTGGVVPLLDAPGETRHYAYYHALTCALSAPTPSHAVVDALIAAGADVNRPAPGSAINVYLSTHRADPAAADGYRWLRSKGTLPVDAAKALVVDDRPAASSLNVALLDEVRADGASSPDCAAAWHGDVAVLAHVVEGPDVPVCRDGGPRTLLDLAAEAGRIGAVTWLLEHGADPNRVLPAEPVGAYTGRPGLPGSPSTAPALTYALAGGRDDVVALLLRRKANPFQGDTLGRPAIDAVELAPRFTADLLNAASPAQALHWAAARAFRDEDARAEAAIALGSALPGRTDPPQGNTALGAVEAEVRDWLDPDLLALLAVRPTRDLLNHLTPRFWEDALASVSIPDVVGVLSQEPARREADLLLSKNTCLPQHNDTRAEARRKLGRPSASDPAADSFVPPTGAHLDLSGRASGVDAAIRVVYHRGRVYRVRVSRPDDVRAAGCDAPALRYLELPRWQRAWEYGATAEELTLYGMPDAHLDSVVWVLDGALSMGEPAGYAPASSSSPSSFNALITD